MSNLAYLIDQGNPTHQFRLFSWWRLHRVLLVKKRHKYCMNHKLELIRKLACQNLPSRFSRWRIRNYELSKEDLGRMVIAQEPKLVYLLCYIHKIFWHTQQTWHHHHHQCFMVWCSNRQRRGSLHLKYPRKLELFDQLSKEFVRDLALQNHLA